MQTSLFDNTENAFKLKSDSELERAYFLFKMISKEPLVRIGTAATRFALNANLPVEGLIRSTVFDHFCGGVNEEDCMTSVDKLYSANVCSVLDYSVEGKEEEASFDECMNKVIGLVEFADEKDAMPIVVFKPTGVGRFAIWQKLTEGTALTSEEQVEWERIKERMHAICKIAKERDVEVLIDGEESWMQDAADDMVAELMATYNKEKPIVYNTLQCYRHDRLEYLKKLHLEARARDFKIGMKIVRGAYMEKENKRAKEKGYPTPICKDKRATDENFNATMRYIFENLDDISLFLGTHNEDSSLLAVKLMGEMGIAKDDNRVWFGQLYGMSDHISFNLSLEGYNVAKYLPFGPVKDVMPYLIRRAEENTSVAGQTNRELELIKAERKRRKL
ncbi:proline dehydrogenase family protein [Dokdonia donghaensis]|uniref:Proline dehydrogenase n=1 Tax=Dokdonia donghaensis DSW-1 TaxID=1300343 RepID=A0A0A2GXF3_9FLAO|nr:proline dehydrogenase family protein [Dokdonia donghaensis]ANH60649.1 Proline dehydrogenase 1 [Dokdonia donghaensis DSW-1]KGO07887.1 proline dehydrogenase [Dokdonia donghaensis DSW-1]